ncbi:uncharacterized protein LY89DRAFT_738793 [Mollisia scopiformis]|uniref:C2H2-type domain-containing protein n=1 Tax=Mollisia scopiformis TaxID=149040 RepID=A0A194WW28_MOLSC|nr:uncharacterized protein LY89DRAFT_738793 [Mollisia scopiformis]KUJ12176.1 hypothetical protein LY89DRAFT_738793 [Mollisia scopiformis]
MSSTVIDLTEDSPSGENLPFPLNAKSRNATTPYTSTRLPPLREVLNYAQPQARAQPAVSQVLADTIKSMDASLLRSLVIKHCHSNAPLKNALEEELLVTGKDVIRYHDGSESEDDAESEIKSDEEGSGDEEEGSTTKPIAIADHEYTSRYTECINCKETFDVTENLVRACYWHPGEKELYDDDDFWADHDEDCHGRMEDLDDDSTYAGGFKWTCCEKLGDSEGCKFTKHQAPINTIKRVAASTGQKRKAEEELPRLERSKW